MSYRSIGICNAVLAIVLLLGSSIAHADQKAGLTCASRLPSDARAIYDAMATKFTRAINPELAVGEIAVSLAESGAISKVTARLSAAAALHCLSTLSMAGFCGDIGDECTYNSDCCSNRCVTWGGDLGSGCAYP